MVPEKLIEVLKYEGVVAIATQGEDGPHLVNTWNRYVNINPNGYLLYPAGGMNQTEANIEKNKRVRITVGSKEVDGFHGKGTGFLIEGDASFIKNGPEFELIKQKFPWARATVKVNIISANQTL
jgi:hypothetical protein